MRTPPARVLGRVVVDFGVETLRRRVVVRVVLDSGVPQMGQF